MSKFKPKPKTQSSLPMSTSVPLSKMLKMAKVVNTKERDPTIVDVEEYSIENEGGMWKQPFKTRFDIEEKELGVDLE